ncbi:MAG TPA: SDR family NAD(P)-dependent oxidoreductase [Methylovirgula sp.]|nr:SDR family NAD(P)-dependent oxidoreductase [Methylovirgula sp.]
MMPMVLVTGGAGFIGCHVCKALLARGYRVRVLDLLVEQVHRGALPVGLPAAAEFIKGDVRDENTLARALRGVDFVIHLAAEVGVGQSMYQIDRYVSVNDLGTAMLFQQMLERPVARVVVASSMSVYGEGLYRGADGENVEDAERESGMWDPLDARGRPLVPIATPEWKRPALASVYALTKFVQERLTLNVCAAYGIEAVALRLFNTYGSGQALSNPYTGVLAIFASRLLNGKAPLVFEDGEQRRDFVHVSDVAEAFVTALEHPRAAGNVYNIGSGESRSILDVAAALAAAMGRDIAPEITGQARAGDIRHCFADISKAERELGFVPRKNFGEGLAELAQWVAQQEAVDRADQARRELEMRGLVA